MARSCRFTAPYGSREIYHDGKPFIEIHRSLNKHGTGSSRPVDVDDTAREILGLLCGTRKSKSALAGSRRRGLRDGAPAPAAPPAAAPAAKPVAGWWPFGKKKPKQLPRDSRRMAQTVMYIPGEKGMRSQAKNAMSMRGARRRRRRR